MDSIRQLTDGVHLALATIEFVNQSQIRLLRDIHCQIDQSSLPKFCEHLVSNLLATARLRYGLNFSAKSTSAQHF